MLCGLATLWPAPKVGTWLFGAGAAGVLWIAKREFTRHWKSWWKRHGSE
jgi:hypothetical protein